MTRYQSGARFERRVKRHYESLDYFVVRSAGSHSPVDLVAIKKDKAILFIQCKSNGRVTPKERDELISAANRAGAIPLIVWRTKMGHAIKVRDARDF